MIPTQGTHRIDDLIHLLQGLAVHALVEFLKVGLDLFVFEAPIEVAGFVICIERYSDDALCII